MKQVIVFFLATIFIFSCKEQNPKKDSKETNTYSSYLKQLMADVDNHPDSIGLRFQLINSLDSAGFAKEALIHMDALIRKDSLNYAFWYRKGELQQNVQDTLGAIVSFKRAIRVYPSPDALLSLANLFAEKKNDSAIALCTDVERINPDRKYAADCSFIVGVYYARTGKSKEAIAKFDECINTSHTYMVAYMEEGFIYFEEKNYKDALKIFQLATTVNNTYSDAYYWQGKCFEAMNNKEEALANYEKSLTTDKNQIEATKAIERLKKQ